MGIGIGDWGLGIGPNPQSPIPNPNPQSPYIKSVTFKKKICYINFFLLIKQIYLIYISSMKKNFLRIDYLGIEPKLHILNSERYQTIVGAMFTIISTLMVIGLSVYFLNIMFERKEMTLLSNPSVQNDPILDFNKIPMMFTLIDTTQNIPYEGIYSILAVYFSVVVGKFPNGTVYTDLNFLNVPLEVCNNNSFGEYSDYFLNYPNIEKNFCLPPGSFNNTIFGIYGSTGSYSGLSFNVIYCSNLTSNNCKSVNDIQSSLTNANLVLTTLDYTIDHNNINNPINLYVKSSQYPVSSISYNRYNAYYKHTTYDSDDGYLFKDLNSTTIIQYDHYDLFTFPSFYGTQLFPPFVSIAQINIINNPQHDQFTRSYLKAQSVIANIGGVSKLIFFISKIFVFIFTKNNFLNDVVYDIGGGFNLINFRENVKREDITNKNITDHLSNNSEFTVNTFMRSEKTKSQSMDNVTASKIKQNFKIYVKKGTNLNFILCPFFSNNNKYSYLEFVNKVIKKKIDIGNIIAVCNGFENFMELFLDKRQLFIFNQVKNISPELFELSFLNSNLNLEDCIMHLKNNDNEINKKLLSMSQKFMN